MDTVSRTGTSTPLGDRDTRIHLRPVRGFTPGAFALAVAALAPGFAAQAAPGDKLGSEFRVNTLTAGNQGAPAIAHASNGDFVVAWADYSTGNAGIYFRRYRADGAAKDAAAVKVAAPFGSDISQGLVANPDVAMDEEGDFVVAWQNNADPQYSANSVRLRRYAKGGQPKDPAPIALSGSCTFVESGAPSVSMDRDGDFVVGYQSYFSDANYASFRIAATRYKADGTAAGCLDLDFGYAPQVAMESDGDFVIAYETYEDGGSVGPLHVGIVARRYAADGTARDADRIPVAAVPPLAFPSDLALNDLGEFIVTWASPFPPEPGAGSNILMRRYNGDGTPKAGAEQVNAAGTGIHRESQIGLANDGSFTVAWERLTESQNNAEVFWRSFRPDGTPVTDFHQRANTFTTGFQDDPALSVRADGGFVVAWESQKQDGSGDGIYAQRFAGNPGSVPIIQFKKAGSSVAESAGTVKLPVLLSTATTRDVRVPVETGGTATPGKDYRLPAASILIPAGQTSADFRVKVINDTLKEGQETVNLTLGTPVNARLGGTPSHRLTVLAND